MSDHGRRNQLEGDDFLLGKGAEAMEIRAAKAVAEAGVMSPGTGH